MNRLRSAAVCQLTAPKSAGRVHFNSAAWLYYRRRFGMRPVLLILALAVACLPEPTRDLEVVVPPSAAHPQGWLRPQLRDHPKPGYQSKGAESLAEFIAPEVISKIVVDQYAGPAEEVRHNLTDLPSAAVKYFGPSLVFCKPGPGMSSPEPVWTSTSILTFKSGRIGRLAIASLHPGTDGHFAQPSPTEGAGCFGPDKVPYDSLYVRYVDPDGYSWYFAVPFQRKK